MKYHLMIIFLLLAAANISAQSETELVGVVQTSTQEPLSNVEVKIIGGGRDITTVSGEFRIRLPISRVGQKVLLQVTKKDWRILNSNDLRVIVPADSVQNPIIIKMRKTKVNYPTSSNGVEGGIGLRKPTGKPKKRVKRKDGTVSQYGKSSNKTTILIANFSSLEEKNDAITETILSQLRNATKEYSDIQIQALGEPITAQEGSLVARARGKERRANIVLWGWYTKSKEKVLINAHFEVLRKPRFLSLRQENQMLLLPISEIEGFNIQFQLSNEMSYLSLLTTGLARLEAEDFDGALSRFTSALAQTSVPDQMVNPADLYFYRGLAYFRKSFFYSQEDLNRAGADFDKAIKLDGNNPLTYLLRVCVYSQNNGWDQVIADCDRALALDATNPMGYFFRGIAYISKGDKDRAVSDLNQASRLILSEYPTGFKEYIEAFVSLIKADFDNGLIKINQAIKINKETEFAPMLLMVRAGAYGLKGDYIRAEADLNQVVKLNPKITRAYWALGNIYEENKNYDKAIEQYTKALQLDPSFTDGYKERGGVYRKKRAYDKAIADYDKAISLNSNDAESYNERGYTYDRKGDLDRALADYNQAIKLRADYPEPYYYRAIVYERKSDLDRAIDDINQFIKLSPDDEDGYYERGYYYERKGNLDRAISEFDRAIKLQSDYVSAYFRRGVVYRRKGALDQAITDLSQSISLYPEHPYAYFYRGLTYADKGNRDLAILDLKKALELTNDNQIRQEAQRKLHELGEK